MKRPLALLSFCLLSLSAACADEATGAASSRTATLPSWTGFYAGVSAGGLWNGPGVSAAPDWSRLIAPGNAVYASAFSSLPPTSFGPPNNAAFQGGGQIGYNLRITEKIVLGVEADFQGVAGGGSHGNSGWTGASSGGPASIGSLRGRAGYLVAPNLQLYGTGGLGYGAGN
jgi:outer membrane immunogenic protein